MKQQIRIVNTTVRLPSGLREQAEIEASLQGQTYSSFMRSLLVIYLREKRTMRIIDAKVTQ